MNFFRQLLAMTPTEREKILAARPAQDRQVFEEKIREFEALTSEQREARLLALQRQLDFRLAIRLPGTNRAEFLSQMPEPERPWMAERLAQWDQVPPDLQTAILTNLPLLRFLFPDNAALQGYPSTDYRYLSAKQRDVMEKAIAEWNQLPDEQRQTISNHFCKFFTLDDKEKTKALNPLNPTERRQMERCLEQFNHLPRRQQQLCLAGFQKFASLTPQERQEFLQNAEQWQKMSPQDRQFFRELVIRLRPPRPPEPPGMHPLPPTPPTPTPVFLRQPSLPLASTNR